MPKIAVVVDRYPCLSETFVENEFEALERTGLELLILCCAPQNSCDTPLPGGKSKREVRYARTGVSMLLSLLHFALRNPYKVLRSFARARTVSPKGSAIETLRQSIRMLGAAAEWCDLIHQRGITYVHSHFMNKPTAVAVLLSEMTGCRRGASAHGQDVFVPRYPIEELCRDAEFVAVCSQAALQKLKSLLSEKQAGKLVLVRHGVKKTPTARTDEVGTGPDDGEYHFLSVSRLVKKKGIDTILRSLAILQDRGVGFKYTVVGEGVELPTLVQLTSELDLKEVSFCGSKSHGEVIGLMEQADLFLLGSRMTAEGDRDGVPNVILEAMAVGTPVVAADAGGVNEVVRNGQTGWLVRADDPSAMADAIRNVVAESDRRRRITDRARQEVSEHFDSERNIRVLASLIDCQKISSDDVVKPYSVHEDDPKRLNKAYTNSESPKLWAHYSKRTLDLVLAIALIIPAALIVGVAAAVILIQSGENPFFVQTRVTTDGRRFRILKLRTLFGTKPRYGMSKFKSRTVHRNKNADKPFYATSFGILLRDLHIDELPQLWNVLTGRLSMVGPRPLVPRDHLVWHGLGGELRPCKSGLTCAFELSRERRTDLSTRRRLDCWYSCRTSASLDLYILYRTFVILFASLIVYVAGGKRRLT